VKLLYVAALVQVLRLVHVVTVSWLHPGALLFDVIYCSDMCKDNNRIASLLESKALKINKGEQAADSFAGWTTANKRTNMTAFHILLERPKWINYGCFAHGLALAMKGFCRCFKTRGCNSKTWGAQWIATVKDATNSIANYLNDMGAAKALLHRYQREVYG
jgi:hypothetical protein